MPRSDPASDPASEPASSAADAADGTKDRADIMLVCVSCGGWRVSSVGVVGPSCEITAPGVLHCAISVLHASMHCIVLCCVVLYCVSCCVVLCCIVYRVVLC
jgi:hypothetical protein